VSDFKQRDDVSMDRLSSFLQKKGMLKTDYIDRIRKNVFYLETNHDNKLILKRHHNIRRVEQQWRFFEQQTTSFIVSFQRYPNQKQILAGNGQYWTISPYIPGQKLNYKTHEDRKASLQTLRTFHDETKGIKLPRPLQKERFYMRSYKRLQHFQKTEPVFWKCGLMSLFTDIVQTTENQLQNVSLFPWAEWEERARKSGTWIHGDVASHNFIRHSGQIYMIDFDLLSCAPEIYDYVQLGQRFLSYLNWDLQQLLSYKMVSDRFMWPWLHAILIPSDIMREWLHYINSDSGRPVSDYLAEMEANWIKRQSFFKLAQSMLN